LLELFPVIDVEGLLKRIPRPERSGYISVVVMLFSLYTILHPHFGGIDCGRFSLYPCAVAKEEITQEEKKHVTLLYFGRGHGGTEDFCHLDMRAVEERHHWIRRFCSPTFAVKKSDISREGLWGVTIDKWSKTDMIHYPRFRY